MRKNNYPKYLALLYAFLVFAAVVSVVYYWEVRNQTREVSVPQVGGKKLP